MLTIIKNEIKYKNRILILFFVPCRMKLVILGTVVASAWGQFGRIAHRNRKRNGDWRELIENGPYLFRKVILKKFKKKLEIVNLN